MTSTNLLSRREQEVAELLLQGKSNKQIASTLGISEHTVEFHLKNVYVKLQVSSRAEAILKLGKSTGAFGGKLGESVVDGIDESAHNNNTEAPTSQRPGAGTGRQVTGRFLRKYKYLISIGLLLAAGVVLILTRPAAWAGYERECEYPDMGTVGQMISRTNASGAKVHGQFGTTGSPAWPVQPGSVTYQNIRIPKVERLYLILRYSKDSSASVPIVITLDDELTPRARIYPADQHNWDQFSWTEPIDLGKVGGGVHSIIFSTDGQQYGVADLDRFILTGESP